MYLVIAICVAVLALSNSGSIITDKTNWGEDIKMCLGQGATYKDIVYYYLE